MHWHNPNCIKAPLHQCWKQQKRRSKTPLDPKPQWTTRIHAPCSLLTHRRGQTLRWSKLLPCWYAIDWFVIERCSAVTKEDLLGDIQRAASPLSPPVTPKQNSSVSIAFQSFRSINTQNTILYQLFFYLFVLCSVVYNTKKETSKFSRSKLEWPTLGHFQNSALPNRQCSTRWARFCGRKFGSTLWGADSMGSAKHYSRGNIKISDLKVGLG